MNLDGVSARLGPVHQAGQVRSEGPLELPDLGAAKKGGAWLANLRFYPFPRLA